MSLNKEDYMTMILSIAISFGGFFAWQKTHPPAQFVRVDVDSVVNSGKVALEKQIGPNMTDEQKAAIVVKIKKYSSGIDQALKSISTSCKCAILNSNALVKLPENGMDNVKDMTGYVQAAAMNAMNGN